ncbi:MMPL family transporter, partial [Staphylococcus pseudintermedius]
TVNTGNATINSDFQTWLGEDLNHATVVTLPITLIILLIVFGAWIVAGLPLLVGLASVFSATGLWAVASQVFPDQGLISHVILLIGLAVGVGYSLFSVRRFREERTVGHQRLEATHI